MNLNHKHTFVLLLLSAILILAPTGGGSSCPFRKSCEASTAQATSEKDTRPHAVLVIGEDHFYRAIDSLWELAQALQTHYGFRTTVLQATSRTSIPGLDALEDADIAIFFIRRRVLSKDSMVHVRAYLAAGKPLVAIRTTSHAFADPAQSKSDRDPWPLFDREVLGSYYQGYYLGETETAVQPEQQNHPILKGVGDTHQIRETLYINLPLAATANVLMMGKAVDGDGDDKRYRLETDKKHIDQPVAWTNEYHGGKIFYTSMGSGRASFKKPWYRRMVINAIFWGLDQPAPQVADEAYIAPAPAH